MKKPTESYCPLTAEIFWLMVQKIERDARAIYMYMFATNTIYYVRFLGKNQISR